MDNDDFPEPHLDPEELADIQPPKPISQLVDDVGVAGEMYRQAAQTASDLKVVFDERRTELLLALREDHLKSAKTAYYTATITRKSGVVITNEQLVVDWLKTNKEVDETQYIGLKRTQFNPLATVLYNNTGELVPGTALTESEFITMKPAKKKEEK